MAKLGSLILTEKDRLWVQVMRAKYISGSIDLSKIRPRNNASNAWRGITSATNILRRGTKIKVGSGMETLFWRDVWAGPKPLLDLACEPIPPSNSYQNVRSYWRMGTGWKWDQLQGILPTHALDHLAPILLREDTNTRDCLIWGASKSGQFNVSFAYNMETLCSGLQKKPAWSSIWKLKVPQRIKTLLWIVFHGRLMANTERCRRRMTTNPCCIFCPEILENQNRLFRDCPKASQIWERYTENSHWKKIHLKTFVDWMNRNLNNKNLDEFDVAWNIKFAVGIWGLWKWRNDAIFKEEFKDPKQKYWAQTQHIREIYSAFNNSNITQGNKNALQMVWVGWTPPPLGCVKLNIDGSMNESIATAESGGILKDVHGKWMGGFSVKLRTCTLTDTEVRAGLHGLRTAWDVGMRKIIIESSSLLTITWLKMERVDATWDQVITL